MSERIDNLRDAVETAHKCKATHIRSEPILEVFDGKVAWEGVVETFDLQEHPKAKRCYAWSYLENGEPKYTTVLELPPVTSAQTAVQVAIASTTRSNLSIFFEGESPKPKPQPPPKWLIMLISVAIAAFGLALWFLRSN